MKKTIFALSLYSILSIEIMAQAVTMRGSNFQSAKLPTNGEFRTIYDGN